MSDQTIPPCPVCGTVPPIGRFLNLHAIITGCKHIDGRHQTVEEWESACNEYLGRACRELGIETVEQLKAKVQPDPRVAVLEAKVKRLLNGIDQHETHKQFVFGVTQHMGKSEPSAADKDLWALKSAELEGSA